MFGASYVAYRLVQNVCLEIYPRQLRLIYVRLYLAMCATSNFF